jgi:tetratricopeptide (TPR) repeat protein
MSASVNHVATGAEKDAKKEAKELTHQDKLKEIVDGYVKSFSDAENKEKYLEEFEKGALDEKNVTKLEFLAAVYSSGMGDFKADQKKAEPIIKKGAELGSTACMISYGERVGANDPVKANEYFQRALNLKDYRAANAMGVVCLRAGKLDEAIGHFNLAATHNVPIAAKNAVVAKTQSTIQMMTKIIQYMKQNLMAFTGNK